MKGLQEDPIGSFSGEGGMIVEGQGTCRQRDPDQFQPVLLR